MSGGKPPCQKSARSLVTAVSIEHQLATDRQTDRHRATANIALLAQSRAGENRNRDGQTSAKV